VKGNIALGQTQNMSDEKIKGAAKIANAYDFVEALSEKFNNFTLTKHYNFIGFLYGA
jgi:subfamily B ATP-binding cassette protein MsbA